MHQIEPESEPTVTDDDSLYLYVNNNIEYRLFGDIVDSYYLDSQIKDDFQCDHDCYSQHRDPTIDSHSNTCTQDSHHITQSTQDLSDSTQQNNLHYIEENVSSFADDADTLCGFSIADHNSDTENTNDRHTHLTPKYSGIHSQRKHAYRNTSGDSHIQYCYIVGLGLNCKFIDLLFKCSVLKFIEISSFIVSLFQKLFTVRQTHSLKD